MMKLKRSRAMHTRKEVIKSKEAARFSKARLNASHSVDLSAEEFANLGDGEVAYVRTMRSEDVSRIFPNAPHIQAGIKIYALLAADGSPILLTDSKDAATAGAWENDLATVSVH
jgi:hypothetical protein